MMTDPFVDPDNPYEIHPEVARVYVAMCQFINFCESLGGDKDFLIDMSDSLFRGIAKHIQYAREK